MLLHASSFCWREGLGIVSEMVLPKPYIDCRYTGVFLQPNFFKKVEIGGCVVGYLPVLYIERATKYATRSLGSAGEHRLHTAGVTGSNPVPTTTNDKAGIKWFRPFSFKWVAAGSLPEMPHASNASKPACLPKVLHASSAAKARVAKANDADHAGL